MSGFPCPHCGKKIEIFNPGGGEEAAGELEIPFLGRIPLDPRMVASGDEGRPFVNGYPDAAAARAMRKIIRHIVEGTNPVQSI